MAGLPQAACEVDHRGVHGDQTVHGCEESRSIGKVAKRVRMHPDFRVFLKNSQIAEELALPPVKIHCSILAEDAIKAAVDDYRKKHLN